MKRTRTFRIEYNYFAPGTYVTPTSPRCPLEQGKLYKVTRCLQPRHAQDDCVIFVEGHERGVTTTYFEEVHLFEE